MFAMDRWKRLNRQLVDNDLYWLLLGVAVIAVMAYFGMYHWGLPLIDDQGRPFHP